MIRTLADYLEEGNESPLPAKQTAPNVTQYLCGCGVFKRPGLIADVSHLPDDLTGGVEWVCDGCRFAWYAEGRIHDGEAVTQGKVHELVTGAPPPNSDHPRWNRPNPRKA